MSIKNWLLYLALFLFVLAFPTRSPQPALPASPRSKAPAASSVITRTLRPDADTYTLRSEPLTNFGEDPFLEITSEPDLVSPNDGSVFLHFDLTSIPAGVTVQSASLSFHMPSGGYGPSCLVQLHEVSEPWDEMTLTLENSPSIDYSQTWQKHLPASTPSFSWDVTDILTYWLAAGGKPTVETYGLVISPLGPCPNYVHFLSSRESPNPPELTVTYTLPNDWIALFGNVSTFNEIPAQRQPLPGATVNLYEELPRIPGRSDRPDFLYDAAQTDQNGDYSFTFYQDPAGPPITYTLAISPTLVHAVDASAPAPGYVIPGGFIRYNPGLASGYYPDNRFYITPNFVPDYQDWTFSGQATVFGRTQPAAGVPVVLYGASNINESENILAGATTDENGLFSLKVERRAGESYANFVLKVADYHVQALAASAGAGGYATEDHRLVFPSPSPNIYSGNSFAVTPPAPDAPASDGHVPGSYKAQPVVAVIINYNCTCGTSSDCQHITNTNVLSAFGETLFGSSGDSINTFFQENSQHHLWLKKAGLFIITPTDDPNTALDESSNCSRNETMEKDRAYYVRDVLGSQLGFNFAAYDKNGDGVVDNSELIVVVAWASPNQDVAKVRSTDPSSIQIGSVKVKMDVASFSVAQAFYDIAHELSHTLTWTRRTGNPGDNYGGQGNPGAYGLMDNSCSGASSAVMNNLLPNTPLTGTVRIYTRRPHLDPWNKIQLGWIISDTYSVPAFATFDAVEAAGKVFRVGAPTGDAGEYFLVENRNPASSQFDSDLLDSGLAIWHINEHYLPDERRVIALERAGGGANSGQATSFCDDDTDTTALWDGTKDFWNGSSPSSQWYSGSNSQVAVACISPPADQVTAYLSNSWNQTILSHDYYEPNDSFANATAITPGAYDLNLHASCDTDVFTITHWTNASIGVTVNAYQDAAHTIPVSAPSVLLEQDDMPMSTIYQGTGSASGTFKNYGITYIKVYGSSQPVYYHMVITNSQSTVPPDLFDDQIPPGEQPNNSFATSAVITQSLDENATWYPSLELDDLNFHNTSDVDFFTFQLPPAVSSSGQPECLTNTVQISGTQVITGGLTVEVVPLIKRAFNITAYDSSGNIFSQYDSLGPWKMVIYCPHKHFSDGKITFQFQDSAHKINFYKIELTYNRWRIHIGMPRWLFYTRPPFPPIPEEFDPRLKYVYPMEEETQWALLGGTAVLPLPVEYLPIQHNFTAPFHIELVTHAGGTLNVHLYDSNHNLVGSGVHTTSSGPLLANPFLPGSPEGYSSQVLDIPSLPAGWYAIALDGASSFTEFWLKFDNHWMYLPLVRR
jgi:M6 family metalloprotease-like protein